MATLIHLADRRDGDVLAAIYRPAVTDGAISFEIEPPDAAAMASRVEKTLSRLPWIVCELDGFVAGYAHGVGYKFGAWHDVGWFERPLAPGDSAPRVW